jgi:spermidine synthase
MRTRRQRRQAAPEPVFVNLRDGTEAELVPDPGRPGGRLLRIGGLDSSYVDVAAPERLHMDYLHHLGVALDVLLPRGDEATVVHLGGGAFALPRFLAATRPLVRQEVYEIEPALVALAKSQLRLRPSLALRVVVGDAAELLGRRPPAGADVVVGDAFDATEVPEQLSGAAVAARVDAALRPGGTYLLNVIDAPPFTASARHAADLRTVFGHVLSFGDAKVIRRARAGNMLFAASRRPLPRAALARALATGPFPAVLR